MPYITDWIISVDDHVLEPAHTWQDRVPAKLKEAAPKLVIDDEGEAWIFEGKRFTTPGLSAAAGKDKEDFSPTPVTYQEMRPGCYDPIARLEDMNRDHVLASLCFPSFSRFCGQTFSEADDKELGLACVEAYNDFTVDEWAGSAPGRFIPMMILPLWDPRLAVQEIERCAARGIKAITFSENPSKLGLPSIHDKEGYWEPVFAAAQDHDLPLCMHIGSSSQLPTTSPDAPLAVTVTISTQILAQMTCIDWLMSGLLNKFPRLRICLSEGGINWIPSVLERAEYVLDRQGAWIKQGDFTLDLVKGSSEKKDGGKGISWDRSPREIFREQIFGCFINETHGPNNIHLIGVDNVMLETDYPHTDSTWPNSLEIAARNLAHLSDEERWKVQMGNAMRVFDFTPAEIPVAVG